MMVRLEALADAIAAYTGYNHPDQRLYKLRNPIGLRAFKAEHEQTPDGIRIFDKHTSGYSAALFDLSIKCGGRSNTGLTPQSSIVELLRTLHLKDETARYVISFLRNALDDPTLTEQLPLQFFLQE